MAAEMMSNAGPHGELLLIEGLLKDANHVIRASAAHGLGHVGPKTIRTLLLALNDKDPMVLKAVTEAIESIGVPAIVE
jgi:HEAT repeat protein